MADFEDPISAALARRAMAPAAQGFSGQDYLNAVQGYAPPPAPAGGAGGAMAAAISQTGGAQGAPESPTFYGYNPRTKQLAVNGQVLPTDFAVWKQAADAADDQLHPMDPSKLFEQGFYPVDKARVQALVAHVQSNAQSSMGKQFGGSFMSAMRDIPAGIAAISSRAANAMADFYPESVAQGMRQTAPQLADVAQGYTDANRQAQVDQRKSMSMEQQAGADAGFTEHPLIYAQNRGAAMAGGAIPMIGGFMINPALGGVAATGGTGGMTMEMAEDSTRQKLDAMSADQLAQNPMYAQLRQQGASDAQAKDAMVRSAGLAAAPVGGALGLATMPFFGRLGQGALRQASVAGLMPEALANRFVTRALATGVEGTALTQATNVPAQMAGEAAAGVNSNNPMDYVHAEDVLNQIAGMGLLGGLARHDPVQVARASDIGAAAESMGAGRPAAPQAPDWGTAPGVANPEAPAAPRPAAPVAPDFTTAPGAGGDVAPRPVAPPAPVAPDVGTTPGAAPPPGPRPSVPVPEAPNWDIQAQGRRGTLAQRRQAQQQELEARQTQSEAAPAALPPTGPTEGMQTRVSSAQQSLDMVNQLLDNMPLNKRTKSGRETLATLQAQKARLEAEVQGAQNNVIADEIATAREQRPPAQDNSMYGDPNTGQLSMIEPGPAPRGNNEPAPIGTEQPMSAQEATARLQAARARTPERQAPQADLFPRQLKQSLQRVVQQSDEGVSPSTREPAMDLQAQMDAMRAGDRDAIFVAKGNEAEAPKVKGKTVRKVVRDEGTLYTTNAAKAKAYREAPQINDDVLAGLQDLPQGKSEALRQGDNTVTQAVDQNGAVVKEALGQGNARTVAEAAPPGGQVRQVPAEAAQARRAALVAAEPSTSEAVKPRRARAQKPQVEPAQEATPKRSKSDQLKDRAAQQRADVAAGKKKVQAEPVRSEEVSRTTAAKPETVKAAEARLRADVEANHPAFAEDVAPPKERKGAGRKAESSLVTVPLTREEMGTLADRTSATAAHERDLIDAGKWTPRQSVVARLLDGMGLVPRSESELKAVVRDLASMPTEQLHSMLSKFSSRVGNLTLAKGIVRGMDNVRAAVHDTMGEGSDMGGEKPLRLMDIATPGKGDEGAKVTADNGRVKVYGDEIPANVADVVHQWTRVIEKTAGHVLPDNIHIMTPAEAVKRYGINAKPDVYGFTSGDVVNPSTGKTERVLAVNWKAIGNEPAAMESLAHEMGHIVVDHIFDKTAKEDQAAVRSAFKDWLDASGRMTPSEQMADRAPPALAKAMRDAGAKPERAYSAEWHEWVADETAKWLLTDQKPKSAVDRFFSKVADALRSLYAQVAGSGRPTEAVQRMMDNFVTNSRALREADAASRAAAMDYGTGAEQPRPAEMSRAKIDFKAVRDRADRVIQGSKGLTEDAGAAFSGDPKDLKRRFNNAVAELGESGAGRVARLASFTVSNMDDMVRRYGPRGDFGKNLIRWDHAKRLAEKLSREAQQDGQLALERAQRLSTPVRSALEQLMYKSTVYGIHPDEAFGTGRNKHLLDDDTATEQQNMRRWGEVKQLWQQLDGLPGKPQKVYQDLRDAMGKLREETFEARRDNIDVLPVSAEAKEEAHRSLNAQEQRMLEGPYFPLVREGSYITTALMPAKNLGTVASKAEAQVLGRREKASNPHAEIMIEKNDDGTWSATAGEKAVYFHNTLRDARNARASIENEMREAWKQRNVDMDAAAAEIGPVISDPYTAVDFFRKAEVPQMGRFMAEINKLHDAGNIDPQAYKQLAEMAIESLPEASPRKAFLARENIRGADQRMLAGYGRRLLGAAHAYGQTKVGREVSEAWGGMFKNRTASPEFGDVMSDLNKRQDILARRMEHNPLNTFASTVQDASSFMSLALSPAFAIQQALQPLILSAPVLAARMGKDGKAVGYGKVMDALKDAYTGAVPFFSKRGAQQFAAEMKRALGTYGGDGQTLQESASALMDKFGRTEGERAMLHYLNDRGTLDFSFLNAVNDASTLSAIGSKAKAIMRLSMAFPQQIEAMNRTVTGLAAYRLAMAERGMEHADAVREANAVVSQTHGDYSRYNRPSAFNRPLLGMALQFKMYTQFMYSLFAHNMATAMNRSLSRDQRAEAMRTLGYVIGSHAAFGGAIGLGPVAAAAKVGLGLMMYGMAGAGLIDKKKRDMSLGDWIAHGTEKWGDDMFGKGNGRALRQVGEYGIPGMLGIDLANKISIPDLTDTRFAGTPSAKDQPGDLLDRAVITALGPVYSNFKRVANGTGFLMKGDLGNASKQMLPAAPRALLNAITEAQDGVVSASGTMIKSSKDISPYHTALRALGLQDPETSMRYEDRAARFAAKDEIQAERDQLLQDYQKSKGRSRVEVMKQISQFNQGRDKQFQITSNTLANQAKRSTTMSKGEKAAAQAIGQPTK